MLKALKNPMGWWSVAALIACGCTGRATINGASTGDDAMSSTFNQENMYFKAAKVSFYALALSHRP